MAKTYSDAEAVKMIASGLIPNYHPELATARIMYIHVDKASSKGGVKLAGKARKLSGFTEWALKYDFVLEIAQDSWNELDSNGRTALVDHLLERCTAEENDADGGSMSWKVREPEVQEFASILQRYGAWHAGLVPLIQVAKEIDIETIAEEEGAVDLAESLVETTSL